MDIKMEEVMLQVDLLENETEPIQMEESDYKQSDHDY